MDILATSTLIKEQRKRIEKLEVKVQCREKTIAKINQSLNALNREIAKRDEFIQKINGQCMRFINN